MERMDDMRLCNGRGSAGHEEVCGHGCGGRGIYQNTSCKGRASAGALPGRGCCGPGETGRLCLLCTGITGTVQGHI